MTVKKSSFSLPDDQHARLVDLADQSGRSQSAVLSDALRQYQPQQPALPTTSPDQSPVDTRFGVDQDPQQPVDTSSPLWQLWTNPYRAWNPDALLLAKTQADQGWMQYCSDLWESMLGDDRISGALEQRVLASEGMPLDFVGSPRAVRRLEALWARIMTPGLRAEVFRWGMGPGVCPVYVRDWVDGEPQGVEVWHPRWLRYYWWERRWKIQCLSGLVDMDSQPGRWYLFCPFGQPLSRPWVTGLWYSVASWWLVKAYAIPDMANYGQTRATPKWFMEQVDGNATISKAEKAQAIRWLAAVPQRSSMYVPWPFKVTQHDSNSTGWEIYIQEVDKANTAVAQRILGHDGSMEKSSTHASGDAAMGVRSDLIAYDCRAETVFWEQGLLKTWVEVNAIPGDVPYPERQTTEPEDLELVSKVQLSAAQAFVALSGAGLTGDLDMRANLGRYFILRDPETGEGDDTAPTDGIQLSAAEAGALSDSCVVRLSQKTGRVRLVSGDPGEDLSTHTTLLLADGRTNFPAHGDDEKVSLRNSRYETFDPDYVDALKEDWPDIWKAGGNIRGNDQYRKLRPVIAAGGAPDGEAEEGAVRLREAWAARHYENKRLAGVVALMKWFVVGAVGAKAMKTVVEEEKDRIRECRNMSTRSERLRDVREHARDGLGFRDAVADQLLDGDLTSRAAGQVLAVLAEATSYEDAKRRLAAALPDLDRRQLRDALSGGLLLTQAAGRLSGGREYHEASSQRSLSYGGGGHLLLDDYKRDDHGRFAHTGSMHGATKSADGKQHLAADGGPLPSHIQALKLPPAWHDVRYNPDPHADLQAIGRDSKGRAQYVYSEKFSNKQAEAKFARIEEMRSKFDDIKAENDHARKSENPVTRDSADAIHVIMHTGIRPGSEHDTGAEKQAYGATTLKAEHVHVSHDGSVSLKFVGKKGVDLDIPIKDEVSARILKTRKESAGGPDKQLFPKATDASLRDLTHTYDGGSFKTKDFRTHHGTSLAYKEVAGRAPPKTKKEYDKATKEVATVVSKALGNTPTVAMQSYINPAVFQGWKSGLKD